jgi:hypothetical protein
MANRDRPTAKGPTTPKEGSPIATAYTVETSTKVMTVSHPNSIPAGSGQCHVDAAIV